MTLEEYKLRKALRNIGRRAVKDAESVEADVRTGAERARQMAALLVEEIDSASDKGFSHNVSKLLSRHS